MGDFFVNIYQFLSKRKTAMWVFLSCAVVSMAFLASQLDYSEDINTFFPEQEHEIAQIFDNIAAKDRFILMFHAENEDDEIDSLINRAEKFAESIAQKKRFKANATIETTVDDSKMDAITQYVYQNLPYLLSEADYSLLDTMFSETAIRERMSQNYNTLISPMGSFVAEHVFKDPMGLAGNTLKSLETLGANFNYSYVDGYIFSKDEKTLLVYIIPNKIYDVHDLVDVVEDELELVNENKNTTIAEYFAVPAIAEYNARQIKKDSLITVNIAIILVILVIAFLFRARYSPVLMLLPVVFGGLFALATIYFIKGEISLIAVGSGSIVLGIVLSYSIHLLSHANHNSNIKEVIRELATPLTIGGFTTIAAFFSLIFTNSKLLQDLGWFSALTLVGASVFTLVFLPHFIVLKNENKKRNKVLKVLERFSNYPFFKNKTLVITILGLFIVSLFFYSKVGFDTNMHNLNYMEPHLEVAEQKLNSFVKTDENESKIIFVASGANKNAAINNYALLCQKLDTLKNDGVIKSYTSINQLIVSESVSQQKLKLWQQYWDNDKQAWVNSTIEHEALQLGFEEGTFSPFKDIITANFASEQYDALAQLTLLFPEWITVKDDITTIIAQVDVPNENKEVLYTHFNDQKNIIAADRGYFASLMANNVKDNFYFVLFISAFIIFAALLFSYGRVELALLAFAPMFVAWIIILGFMAILGIEFNIVTIILSTFIFGIGDDFSIFVTDGLLRKYKDGVDVYRHHKIAILFSAFALLVGMGALVFAQHPAMKSLGLLSLLGMLVVVLVSYTIQPILFKMFVTLQTKRGGFPYTCLGLLNTIYAFGLFVVDCIMVQLVILITFFIPVKKEKRKEWISALASWGTRTFLRLMVTTKMINLNPENEDFKKPAVIIANHQSFIDILLLLGLHRKLVMVTNSWVWNSPVFGKIVRFLEFYHTADGYENIAEKLEHKIKQGYSVIVFPEGTRSPDHSIQRFHKGAFYLAELLKLDVLPILVYGNGLVSSKTQPFYIKKGYLMSKILLRIKYDDSSFGTTYQERTKKISRYFKEQYHLFYEEYNRVVNPYFKQALMMNYIYKGPVLEWYMRVKLKLENYYEHYDQLVPRSGHIVDLGCGYGAMSYMLMMLSNQRTILGVDYDGDKIDVANHTYSKNERINFVTADLRNFELPKADAFIISDVLHYFDAISQKKVIEDCIKNLQPNGVLLIRDGDKSNKDRHHNTELTEKWSTKILKFNKIDGNICFFSKEFIEKIAHENNMNIETIESDKTTSNTLFILKHNK